MSKFKLSPENQKKLHQIAQRQAEEIAKEFEDKMSKKYTSLIAWYYAEPYETGEPHYKRTNNLEKSYRTFMFISPKQVSSSFLISGDDMDNYKPDFSGEDLLRGFFFVPGTPSVTWHGGDWHGGRGTMAKFSVAEEMYKYYHNTVKDFRKKYGI